MASATTTAMSQSSAAARVFAIPELLEQILLEVATQASRSTRELELEPVTTTSRCQSMNRTFHATVRASENLQRLIETAHQGQPQWKLHWLFWRKLKVADSPGWRSAGKFLHYHLQPESYEDGQYPNGMEYNPSVLRPIAELEVFRQHHSSSTATWRQVKLQRNISIELLYLAPKYDPKHPDNWHDRWTTTVLEFPFEDTLGMVFDRYCALLDKAVSDRMDMEINMAARRIESQD